MNIEQKITNSSQDLHLYINFKLAALGLPYYEGEFKDGGESSSKFIKLTDNLIQDYQELTRLMGDHLPPPDNRIQIFLNKYLSDVKTKNPVSLPQSTFIMDQAGIARLVSLPPDKNTYKSDFLSSYRTKQGILHNPTSDRRTTEGSFHIVEGGLPVPPDKKEVSKLCFANLLNASINPPESLLVLPYTHTQEITAKTWVSLYLRPIVCPEVENFTPEKTMEIRFFAPGGLVSNLDFIENIFGNAGDPNLDTNDAALDFEHWTGHTGCIILAPHIVKMRKKDLGLPPYDQATERQKRDGMCWKNESELYNEGNAFKLTCRDASGVVVTLIADNYYGYSKKEIKTQISYAANLYGLVEEEHAGGAVAFHRKNIGETFIGELFAKKLTKDYSFEEVKKIFGNCMEIKPENYGIDLKYSNIIYIPENANINLYDQKISWLFQGKERNLKLLPNNYYIHPSGFKLHMEKHPAAPSWRLVSTYAEGVFTHKPSTVSGGGKSEISKSLLNNVIYGPFYVNDKELDFETVEQILKYDYSNIWKTVPKSDPTRPLLSPLRSLGSVVRLLTPSVHYTDDYNQFLRSIPDHVKALTLFVKRFYRPERDGKDWRDYFSVNKINGRDGHELLFNKRPIMASYLRMGLSLDGSWNLSKVRSDFIPAAKLQMEDDISATIVLPSNILEHLNETVKNKSLKLVANCERNFFQRPDDAINRGMDKQAETDMALQGVFTTNYEPLSALFAHDLFEDAIGFHKYSYPIREMIRTIVKENKQDDYFVVPSHPRIVGGKPSKNPRYLQQSPVYTNPIDYYLGEMGVRFARKIPLFKPVYFPVNSVVPGRRNNPPDYKNNIRPLSVYNPIHYQELPELFMDFICSLTGKSPSTTGAGSEGALTKGPFNMLVATTDLNNALLSYILTEYHGFSSAAGWVGTNNRFDHDISMLIPELWCRMEEEDRDPKKLIDGGFMEKINDFEHNGKPVFASRLGYRITDDFLYRYMGSIFDEPETVFEEQTLKPELQDIEAFVDGINNIVEAQQKVALSYFEDGSVEAAIPPLKILLHVMAFGNFEGKSITDSDLRKMFSREYVLQSDWYIERLKNKQTQDIALLQRKIDYAQAFMNKTINKSVVKKINLTERLQRAGLQLAYLNSEKYYNSLIGTIGLDKLFTKA